MIWIRRMTKYQAYYKNVVKVADCNCGNETTEKYHKLKAQQMVKISTTTQGQPFVFNEMHKKIN